jgi:hypothetical protein
MNYHLVTVGLVLAAGACVVLFGLGLVGAIFLVFAVLLEGACWVRAWRHARRLHTSALK